MDLLSLWGLPSCIPACLVIFEKMPDTGVTLLQAGYFVFLYISSMLLHCLKSLILVR